MKTEAMSMLDALIKLKVGDFVETWVPSNGEIRKGTITAVHSHSIDMCLENGNPETGYSADDRLWVLLKPLNNKTNTMSSLLSKIRSAFEQEPEKSLKHFGFIDDAGDLTADGKEVLLNLLFKVNPEIFNEAIAKLKEEEEAAKK